MNQDTVDSHYWIESLNLAPHPEGGYFRETYRAPGTIPCSALQPVFAAERNYCTAIYYLLQAGDYSAFHRIRSDEIWHFHAGGTLRIEVLERTSHRTLHLGRNIHQGESLQCVVPAGAWFAATPAPGTTYVLAGCTVSPGFDFGDFEMAERESLSADYPEFRSLIDQLTR